MTRWMFISGAVSAALSVALGAFGAHALKATLSPDLLSVFETGCRYQMYHALALLALSAVSTRRIGSFNLFRTAAFLFIAGTVLFSGSLYLYAGTGLRSIVMVTPIGGILFLAGWVVSILGAGKKEVQ
ncbi:MAG: DUF423 domain-containing protein [Ignavibacteria bacterium]|nr:DUF423 domain-containing protein [Ignavibacteria bacterium]